MSGRSYGSQSLWCRRASFSGVEVFDAVVGGSVEMVTPARILEKVNACSSNFVPSIWYEATRNECLATLRRGIANMA